MDEVVLTTGMLDEVCRLVGEGKSIDELKKAHRFEVANKLVGLCGLEIMKTFQDDLQKGDLTFIARRVEVFLTARGFEDYQAR